MLSQVAGESERAAGCRCWPYRAPTFDYDALLQIKAFMLECLRWRPVTTIGFAHCAPADIVYKGQSHATPLCTQPYNFDPERWLNNKGKIRHDIKFPSYGFGRKICPGRYIAFSLHQYRDPPVVVQDHSGPGERD
ncbi:hypothetical protein F4604DRAFT_491550 [Suillus subluteus]|nr:hypothetical protein F4604DRAFT_491550 [Suillus subluteus]